MISVLLYPFTLIYRFGIFCWNLYWMIRKPVSLSARVISVGGLTAGGSGKTSVTIFLAKKALEKGKRAAVVAKGYKRRSNDDLVVGDHAALDWEDCGDEPLVMAKSVSGLNVYIGESKTNSAVKAASDGHDPIIIDDGFQHRKLKRDIDILCFDGTRPFGNGMMLPAGRLREPKSAIKRADIIIIIDPEDTDNIRNLPSGIPVFEASKISRGIESMTGGRLDDTKKRCVAFCGIGNPASFRQSLAAGGLDIRELIEFRDHHKYQREDLDRIVRIFEISGADFIVTTLKDAVKLEKIWNYPHSLYYLDIEIKIKEEDDFLAAVGI